MSVRPTRPGQRGATLIEVMITMGVILIGMMGLFKVLGASIQGSASAQRFTQGQSRAQQVLEAMAGMPQPVLGCLAGSAAANWGNCEALCKATLGAQASLKACVFTTLSINTQDMDKARQQYTVVVDQDLTRSSFVNLAGSSARVYDIQITIGWNDNGTANPVTHRVTARTAVFR